MPPNPFRISGSITGAFFTDRADEVRRITHALTEPQAKLLVYGPRRMGKTSALEVAVQRIRKTGHHAVMADFSTVSSVADMSTRLLQAATKELGRAPERLVKTLLSYVKVGISFSSDPATGLPTASLDVSQREASLETQRQTFADVLNAIDALAASKRKTIGIVLDEFQEIHRFGGEVAEWHLRGTIQVHKHVSYVLAGSRESLILEMAGKQRAFYEMLEHLYIGPVDPEHMADWIDGRMRAGGVTPHGVGREIVALAGPRSRDIVQLARATYAAASSRGRVASADAMQARDAVVAELSEGYRAEWERLTPLQQNVLRAVVGGEVSLFGAHARQRYALGSSAAVSAAIDALVKRDLLVKEKNDAGYNFDSPFMRRWVELTALPDIR